MTPPSRRSAIERVDLREWQTARIQHIFVQRALVLVIGLGGRGVDDMKEVGIGVRIVIWLRREVMEMLES